MNGANYKVAVLALAGFFVGMAGTAEKAAAGGQQETASARAQGAAAAQAIETTPGSVTFQDVPVGELYTQTVRVSNLSGAPIKITKIVSSTAAFAVTGISLPAEVEAGGNVNFTVGYRPKAARSIAGQVSIETDTSAAPVALGVKASSTSKELGLYATETSVDFGVVAIGKKETKELVVENGGNSDVVISRVTVNGGNFTVLGGDNVRLSPGQRTSLLVQFDPQSNGKRQATVSILSSAQAAAMEIPVSGTGAAMSGKSVTLKWEESLTSVAGYNIYRSNEQEGSYIKLEPAPVTVATYMDSGLAAGQTYSYLIRAVDTNNVESDDSEEITVMVPEE